MLVNLFDTNFITSKNDDGFDTATKGRMPTKIQYVRNLNEFDGVTIFTDEQMFSKNVLKVKSRYKIGWCQESPEIKPLVYHNVHRVEDRFDYIMTFHPNLLKRNSNKYKLALIGGSWVKDYEWQIYPKTKLISIIASNKNYAPGHILRHEVIKKMKGLDVWGSGYNKFESKLEPLKDYMFSIAIINCKINNYWTEILTDCFATGTVPIFWGAPNIGEFFNLDGMIIFDTIEDLSKINLNEDLYYAKMDAIIDNFNRSQKYASTDDMLADSLRPLVRNNFKKKNFKVRGKDCYNQRLFNGEDYHGTFQEKEIMDISNEKSKDVYLKQLINFALKDGNIQDGKKYFEEYKERINFKKRILYRLVFIFPIIYKVRYKLKIFLK